MFKGSSMHIDRLASARRDSVNPYIEEVLGDLFKLDCILASDIHQKDFTSWDLEFNFSTYDKTRKPLGHIPASMMHGALAEALILSLSQAADSKFFKIERPGKKISLSDSSFKYPSKPIENYSSANLGIRLNNFQREREGSTLDVEVSGFIRGKTKCNLFSDYLSARLMESSRGRHPAYHSEFVLKAIGPIYKKDRIIACSVQSRKENQHAIRLRIPESDKLVGFQGSIPDSLLQEAITESLLLAVAKSIEDGTFSLPGERKVDLDWFHANFTRFFLRGVAYNPVKPPFTRGDTVIGVRVGEFKGRDYLGKVKFKLSGDVEGTAICVLNLS